MVLYSAAVTVTVNKAYPGGTSPYSAVVAVGGLVHTALCHEPPHIEQ